MGMKTLLLLSALNLLSFSAAAAESPIRGGRYVENDERIAEFTVAVRHAPREGREFCSGSLIAHDIVLTAAHCMVGEISVHFGTDALHPQAIREVESVTPYPGYRETTYEHDFAILKLSSPAPPFYRPISLPGDVIPDSAFPEVVHVAGFGLDEPGFLKTTSLEFRSVSSHLLELRNHLPFQGIDHGDSGGPAFTFVDGQAVLLGVTRAANDSQCDFSRVDADLEWIESLY
jgi:hypothetical protein